VLVYHSGIDRYSGMAEKLRTFGVHVALFPINGPPLKRRVAGNLSGPEAAQLAKDISAKGGNTFVTSKCFEFNTASRGVVNECRRWDNHVRCSDAAKGGQHKHGKMIVAVKIRRLARQALLGGGSFS